jgi:hypothetical protein
MRAYLTDIEGQWSKLEGFARENPCVRLDGDALRVADGGVFVFGGDAIDRGPASRRIVRALADAKRRQPDAVVLLAGNRDLNKLRLVRELAGEPPPRTPDELRDAPPEALLPWIFEHTMGAKTAFAHRRAERLGDGLAADDAAVAQSFLDDLHPEGELARYLALCQLAHRDGDALFVHGAVTAENLGVVPGLDEPVQDLDAWVAALNGFYARGFDAWRRGETGGDAAALIAYQAPIPDTKQNARSVVYGRPTDDLGAPWLPPREVVARLRAAGIHRLLLGHTPSGDCPAVLCDEGFVMVMADNSYGRVEGGSRVILDGEGLRAQGETVLDDGRRVAVDSTVRIDDPDPLLGRWDADSGALVKARLVTGEYLLFRALPQNQVSQTAVTATELQGRALTAPYRPEGTARAGA